MVQYSGRIFQMAAVSWLLYMMIKVQRFIYLLLYNTGLYNEIQAVVPLCYTQKTKRNKEL